MTAPRNAEAAKRTRILSPHATPATLAAAEAISAPALAPGQVLGDYEVQSLLGEGGMGQVWRARHCTLNRIVALKTMRRGDNATWARFAREAQMASTLDHAHIAKLYEFSYDPPFMAFQLIAGSALAGRDQRAMRALQDAAAAVHYAHRHGVLHRDLKPDNIIVDTEGCAYVLDFGLARPLGDDDHLTMSGEVVGTPAFMSPEQAAGDAHLTPRSDIYALGAILYTMLSGHAPYCGSGAWDVIRLVQISDPPKPGGDRDLETICLKAMAREPERRYPTAQAFADDLGRWLRREPVLARRAGLGYRVARSIQRRTAVWVLSALLILAAAITAITGVILLAQGNRHLRESARAAAIATHAVRERSEALAADASDAELETLVSARERALADHHAQLERALAPAELARERAALEADLGTIAQAQSHWPQEPILDCLAGETLLALNREQEAIGRFDAALGRPSSRISRSFGVAERAHLDRATALLLSRFADLMCRLMLFQDTAGYQDVDPARSQILADLAATGSAHGYESQVLILWCRYVAAACDRNPMPGYVVTRKDALALIAKGGRSDELLQALAGVLDAPPRSEAVADFTAAISREHNFAQAWMLRAQERSFYHQDDEARADIDAALARKPDYGIAHYLRSQLPESRSEADMHTALAHADQAVRLDPAQPICLWGRARWHWVLHDWDAAFADAIGSLELARATPSFRSEHVIWTLLARLEEEAGRTQDAIRCREHAIALGHPEFALDEAEAALGSEPLPRTASRLASLLDRTEPEWLMLACQAREWLGEQQLSAGDRDGARTQATWVLAHVRDAPRAALLLGRARAAAASSADAVRAAFGPSRAQATQSAYAGTMAKQLEADVAAAEAAELERVGDDHGASADVERALALVGDHAGAWAVRLRTLRAGHDQAALAAARTEREQQLLASVNTLRATGSHREAERVLADFLARAGPDAAISTVLTAVRADRAAIARAAATVEVPR